MTELKTLKNLQMYGNESNYPGDSFTNPDLVSVIELRKEAIKWIKAIDAYEARHKEACDLTVADFCCGDGARAWILNFFNITEEDLK